jgi:branched-chain amino acid transport system substrate-binding protein
MKNLGNLKKLGLFTGMAIAVGLASNSVWAQDCEVKIGAVGPFTGGAAAWGLSTKAGTEFAAALVNQEGGLQMGNRKCQVKVVSIDSQCTAAGGAAASNFLASEKVHVTNGPVCSPETTGFRPVAKRHGQINFSSSYMLGVISPEFPLAFHALQAPITFGPVLTKEAAEQFKFKTIMVIGPNDQGGTDGSRQLVKQYSDNGIKASEEYYQRGTTNFGPLATRIMNAGVDAIEIATVPPADQTILIRQLLEAGYSGTIGSLGGGGIGPVVQAAGGLEKLKAFYWLETSPVDHPGIVKMKADYERVMKAPPIDNPLLPVFALSAEVILRAISQAGTDQDPEKIAEALRKMTPESRYMGKAGWRGKSLYGINQELTFPPGLGMVIGGKKLPVKTVAIAAE